jgi:hypothetical protein
MSADHHDKVLETCTGYGFHPGTDAFASCLQKESLARRYLTPPLAPYWGWGYRGWGRPWGLYWPRLEVWSRGDPQHLCERRQSAHSIPGGGRPSAPAVNTVMPSSLVTGVVSVIVVTVMSR